MPYRFDRLPKLDRACRDVQVRALPSRGADEFKRFELSVSSEYPVQRWFGNEILIHSEAAVDLSRMNDGAPVLLQHDGYQQIGRVERAELDGKRLKAELVFSRASQIAREVAQDIADGIRRNVSIGYIAKRARLVSADEDGDTWEIDRWQPMEVSIVSVPADPTVGFDRASTPTFPVEVVTTHARTTTMTTPNSDRLTRSERRAGAELRDEAAEIARLANKHGFGHRASEWLGRGLTPEQVSREILALRAEAQPAPLSGMSTRELLGDRAVRGGLSIPRDYSLARAILSAADGADSLERDYSVDLARQHGRNVRGNGILIPLMALSSCAMDTLTPTQAAEIVFDQPGQLIELLRATARVIASGATVLTGLQGPVPFPKQTGAAQAFWMQENPPADVSESSPAFGTVTATPKTLMAYTAFSRQLLVQSSLNVEAMVRNELAVVHGLAVDRAALHGAGAGNEPLGIYKSPDVNTQAMGGAPTYALLVDMLGKVASDNALLPNSRGGWLATSGIAAKLMKTVEFATAGSKAVWTGSLLEGQIAGYPAAATNQLSNTMSTLEPAGGTEHGLVFGNWADLLIALWGVLEIVVDPYTQARKGIINVTSFQMADICIRHGESFCVATGATTS